MKYNKRLVLFVVFIACACGVLAQGESGYWKFREASVYGADTIVREDAHGTVTEFRDYNQGNFSVTRNFTAEGQQFVNKCKGTAKGLANRINPGDELTVSFNLSSIDDNGPRANAIWARATVLYGRLPWTVDTWEDRGIKSDVHYNGEFMTEDNEYLVCAENGGQESSVVKNNAVTMKEAGSDKMYIIISCGGMDVVFHYQWIDTQEAWICKEMTYPRPGTFKGGLASNIDFNLKQKNNIYLLEYKVSSPFTDKRGTFSDPRLAIVGVNRFGETGKAKFHIERPTPVLYPGHTFEPVCEVISQKSSRQDQQDGKGKTDEQQALEDFMGTKTAYKVELTYPNLANEGRIFEVMLHNNDDSYEPTDVSNGFRVPDHKDVQDFVLKIGFSPVLVFQLEYQWGSPEDLEKGDEGGSPLNGGSTDGGEPEDNGGGGIPWGPIGVGGGGVIGWAVARRIIKKRKMGNNGKKGKKLSKVKQKAGESSSDFRDRQIKAFIDDEGIRHPIPAEKGETFGEWRARQEIAERQGREGDRKQEKYINEKSIKYGTSGRNETYKAAKQEQEKGYEDKKSYDRSARNWDIAYKTANGAKVGAKIGLKGVELTGKATGNGAAEYGAKGLSSLMDGVEEYETARVIDGASVGKAATRASIKGVSSMADSMASNNAVKAGINVVTEGVLDVAKTGKLDAKKALKGGVNNLVKNTLSGKIGSFKDSSDLGFNTGQAAADYVKGELTGKVKIFD